MPGRAREPWVDFAKGAAILLVVLYHAVLYLQGVGLAQEWGRVSNALDTLRMPLFFTMSGMMATRVVRLPYRQLFDRRIRLLLYLYVLWCVVQWVCFSLLPPFNSLDRRPEIESLYLLFLSPNANLWFIYALPIYLSAAWLLNRFPVWVQIALAAFVSAAFGLGALGLISTPWGKTGRYLVFFIVALHIAPWLMRVAQRARWRHVMAWAAGFAATSIALMNLTIRGIPFSLIVGGITAVGLGVAASVVLVRFAWLDWVRHLGTKTLPIYLIHTLPFGVIAAILLPMASGIPTWLGVIAPPILTAISVGICLLLERPLRDVPGVLTLPRWLRPRPIDQRR